MTIMQEQGNNRLLAQCRRYKLTARIDLPYKHDLETMMVEFAERFAFLAHDCCADPQRSYWPWSFAWIVGTRTSGRCDSKCWSSTSAKCKCSCGGEMHASNHSDATLLAIGQMK